MRKILKRVVLVVAILAAIAAWAGWSVVSNPINLSNEVLLKAGQGHLIAKEEWLCHTSPLYSEEIGAWERTHHEVFQILSEDLRERVGRTDIPQLLIIPSLQPQALSLGPVTSTDLTGGDSGWKIMIQSGILRLALSHEEKVAVLAHEYGHLLLGHTGQPRLNAVVRLEVLKATNKAAYKTERKNIALLSRQQEYEADRICAALMRGISMDPIALIRALEKIEGDRITEWSWTKLFGWVAHIMGANDHPLLRDRMEAILKQ